MKNRLLWKLLLINVLPVVGVIVLVIWLAIDQLAADYFMVLMDKYDVSPTETHQMFLSAVHRYLLWAALAALLLAFFLSFLLTRRVLRPLAHMAQLTERIADGDFSGRVQVSTDDEVGQLGEAFNRMADTLAELDQLRRSLVTDVAHELRTPLTNLRGYFEGLADGVLSPEAETFHMLQQEVMRLVHLVEEMQQLAKAETAKTYLACDPLSLTALIQSLLALSQAELSAKQLQVELNLEDRLDAIRADRERLLQVFRNLLDNAIKYTPTGGRIRVWNEPHADGVKLIFANTGPGIPEDDLPYVFERFFRADRSRTRRDGESGGAGIGLAIVKSLVEAHGGQVGAASSGDETHVWVSLPLKCIAV